MRQALKIKCWDCEEVFTPSAEVSTQPGGPLVNVVVVCLFCNVPNQVTLRANQLQSTTLYRGGDLVETVDLSQPGALLNQVFAGAKPTES